MIVYYGSPRVDVVGHGPTPQLAQRRVVAVADPSNPEHRVDFRLSWDS